MGGVGGPCDYCVTPVPIGLGFALDCFWFWCGSNGTGLDLGLDNNLKEILGLQIYISNPQSS